jgi:hypothetical protein
MICSLHSLHYWLGLGDLLDGLCAEVGTDLMGVAHLIGVLMQLSCTSQLNTITHQQ